LSLTAAFEAASARSLPVINVRNLKTKHISIRRLAKEFQEKI